MISQTLRDVKFVTAARKHLMEFHEHLQQFVEGLVGPGKAYRTLQLFCKAIGINPNQLPFYIIEDPAKRRLPHYDVLLRLRRFGFSIDAAMDGDPIPDYDVIVSLSAMDERAESIVEMGEEFRAEIATMRRKLMPTKGSPASKSPPASKGTARTAASSAKK